MFRFSFTFSRLLNWFLASLLALIITGCLPPRSQPRPPADVLAAKALIKQNEKLILTSKRLRRKRISSSRNLYEGSLWRYESSFGNLLRDHRARFRGDLLSINEMSLIVNVPPPKLAPEGQPAGGAETANVA